MPHAVIDVNRAFRVDRRLEVADDVILLTLVPTTDEPVPAWEAGSHLEVLMPGGPARQYSLCGPAGAPDLTIAVLREPSGVVSNWLHDRVEEGSTLHISSVRNHFELVRDDRYVFIAGGIGITPILPMIEAAERAGAQWSLHYGGRSRRSMAFVESLGPYGDRVDVVPQDQRGLLDLHGILPADMPRASVYCCGPEPLVVAVEEVAARRPQVSLHVERFKPRVVELAGPERAFSVHCALSEVTLQVPADRSILEVLLDADIDVPSSCSEGTCGTCETYVLDGEPDHRDSVLTDDERAGNRTMMVCVSRSRTDSLTLDL